MLTKENASCPFVRTVCACQAEASKHKKVKKKCPKGDLNPGHDDPMYILTQVNYITFICCFLAYISYLCLHPSDLVRLTLTCQCKPDILTMS